MAFHNFVPPTAALHVHINNPVDRHRVDEFVRREAFATGSALNQTHKAMVGDTTDFILTSHNNLQSWESLMITYLFDDATPQGRGLQETHGK